jgi:hypothetical protein
LVMTSLEKEYLAKDNLGALRKKTTPYLDRQ